MNFVREVLVPNPGLQLQIAHLGGQGSYDTNTHEALNAWADALNTGLVPEETHVGFDISATVTRHPSPEYAQIAETIRKLGTERIYIGSDWPAFNQPRWVALNFWNQVPLSKEELSDILDNVAPWFER
jgi:predicted TIM-barrel fold metal-dependent hydrolase